MLKLRGSFHHPFKFPLMLLFHARKCYCRWYEHNTDTSAVWFTKTKKEIKKGTWAC